MKGGTDMNNSDRIFIGMVTVLSIALFFSVGILADRINADNAYAVVSYKDKESMRLDMNKDGLYDFMGDEGPMVIEVEKGAIRVKEEVSPLNYCSKQGWVSTTNTPIVCLPNSVIIIVHNNVEAEGDITIR